MKLQQRTLRSTVLNPAGSGLRDEILITICRSFRQVVILLGMEGLNGH